jgi:hypothetical protein
VTAATSIFNVGIGFVMGLLLHWAFRRGWIKL